MSCSSRSRNKRSTCCVYSQGPPGPQGMPGPPGPQGITGAPGVNGSIGELSLSTPLVELYDVNSDDEDIDPDQQEIQTLTYQAENQDPLESFLFQTNANSRYIGLGPANIDTNNYYRISASMTFEFDDLQANPPDPQFLLALNVFMYLNNNLVTGSPDYVVRTGETITGTWTYSKSVFVKFNSVNDKISVKYVLSSNPQIFTGQIRCSSQTKILNVEKVTPIVTV